MLLGFLPLAHADSIEAVLDRFEGFIRRANSLSVSVKLKVEGSTAEGDGTFSFKRPNNVAFRMKWGPSDYQFAANSAGGIEVEHSEKRYREYSPIPEFGMPESGMSPTPSFGFPTVLLIGDLRKAIPADAKYTHEGSRKLGGVSVETVSGAFETMAGAGKVTASIDGSGRLVHMRIWRSGTGGESALELAFSKYVVNGAAPMGVFSNKLPLGYSPDALPHNSIPQQAGEKIDLSNLSPIGSGQKVDLRSKYGKSPLVLIVADAGCAPSTKLLGVVNAAMGEIRGLGGKVAIVWMEKRGAAPGGVEEFKEPSGDALARFGSPGTPLVCVVDASGTVGQVWYGFDATYAAQFRKELVAAVRRAKG